MKEKRRRKAMKRKDRWIRGGRWLLAIALVGVLWIGVVQVRMATLPDRELPPQDVGIVLKVDVM